MASKVAKRAAKPADLSLIETLRWEPAAGFLRIDQHLRRLTRSADALGFRPPPADLQKQLNTAGSGDQTLHIRLEMSYRGHVEITAAPFAPLPAETLWRVRIAATTLPSDDTMFRHKSSRREPYEAARAEYTADEVDELILLNERGEICDGTATSIFVEQPDGTLLTPPLSSGILPGVLRAELIREGRAKSGLLKPQDLAGRTLFVGSSLRGLIRAELVDA